MDIKPAVRRSWDELIQTILSAGIPAGAAAFTALGDWVYMAVAGFVGMLASRVHTWAKK